MRVEGRAEERARRWRSRRQSIRTLARVRGTRGEETHRNRSAGRDPSRLGGASGTVEPGRERSLSPRPRGVPRRSPPRRQPLRPRARPPPP